MIGLRHTSYAGVSMPDTSCIGARTYGYKDTAKGTSTMSKAIRVALMAATMAGSTKSSPTLTAKQSSKLCETAINNVRKLGNAAETAIHNATKLVIRHAERFHDTDKAKKLVQALSEVMPGYATNQLVVFIEKHSPIKFQYDDTKTKVVGVKEDKDIKTGELKRPYADDAALDAAPLKEQKAVRDQGNRKIEPWSYAMYKDRLAGLENQLVKAIEPDGRGILGADGKTLHKGDKGFEEAYAPLFNVIHQHRGTLDNLLPLVKGGMPVADAAKTVTTAAVEKLVAKKDTTTGSPTGRTARKAA